MGSTHEDVAGAGDGDDLARFAFGENWSHFLSTLSEEQIEASAAALREYLEVDSLKNLSFLDIGSGSGLSSLAARRLGANVTSFDYDRQSVACTTELRRRYFENDETWSVCQGSALDAGFMASLGEFDIVYSWGVLHHTGEMWLGFEHALQRVRKDGGKLFIAIYNDQGWKSRAWWFVKAVYNALPRFLRQPYALLCSGIVRAALIVKYTFKLEPMTAIRPLLSAKRERGMRAKYDRIDWIGGLPYEFAKMDTLIAYFEARGFVATKARPATSLGCHEIVFQRRACAE